MMRILSDNVSCTNQILRFFLKQQLCILVKGVNLDMDSGNSVHTNRRRCLLPVSSRVIREKLGSLAGIATMRVRNADMGLRLLYKADPEVPSCKGDWGLGVCALMTVIV